MGAIATASVSAIVALVVYLEKSVTGALVVSATTGASVGCVFERRYRMRGCDKNLNPEKATAY
ncbi:MAG: hypothetical protein EBT19_02980 [Methylocystaceae bacterium]|nr:hypothetical protein [Methylocystaceae bacterium]